MHCLFIYGTLKRGFPNFRPAMNDARFIGNATTKLSFPLVIGGPYFSPILIDEAGTGHRVRGELFEVGNEILVGLDSLESTHLPNGYRRITIEVTSRGNPNALEVGTYVKARDVIEGIHSEPLREYKQDPRYITIANR